MTVHRRIARTALVAPVAALLASALSAAAPAAQASATPSPSSAVRSVVAQVEDDAWEDVSTGVDEQYRGLDAVTKRVAWVSGENGSVLRTTNGGRSWQDVSPRRTVGMAFRDVEATGARHASVLAIGEGDDSRIYTTRNGGRTWKLAFVNHEPTAFYDCMDFWGGGRHGLAMSDPVDGKFRIIRTRDGGRSWNIVSNAGMPAAVDGEFAFAASGTCLVTAGRAGAYLASGGAASRIFSSHNRGRTWKVVDAPIPAADAGGVFSLAFKNPKVGIAVGGDFLAPDAAAPSGLTRSYGKRWSARGDTSGYRSGVAWIVDTLPLAIAVGPTGTDLSVDNGRIWQHADDTPYDSVQCTKDTSCWASGPGGAVGRIVF